jgi:hypothetical protein
LHPAAAIAARGNNLVFTAPPSPAEAAPVLEAAIGRVDDDRRHPVLLVAPEAALGAWSGAAAAAAAARGRRSAVGPTPGRAAHHITQSRVDLLVATLPVATELIRRSTLRLDQLTSLILVWPELELSDESFVPLFADLPKETQRILITADPAATAPLAERYAWRAPLVGSLGAGPIDPADRIRTVAVSWEGRPAALAAVADLADLDQLAVWTAAEEAGPPLAARLAGHGVTARLVTGPVPGPGPLVFFDPPPPELLTQVDPATTYLLVPPGAEPYVTRAVRRPDPLELPNVAEQAGHAMAADRRAIRSRIEAGPDRGAFATVAPLFDQWSATDVAVALQSLWQEARSRPRPDAPSAPVTQRRAPPKVWASIGRKDGLTIGEWMGLLTLDLGLRRDAIGKIKIRETGTLTEFSNGDLARAAAEKLAGHTFKNRRLTARIDRGTGPKRSA